MRRIIVQLSIAILVAGSVLGLSACQNEADIVLASKPMTEQYILAEMIIKLIEDNTDLTVDHRQGIGGGTANIHPGMVSGEIDMYPEYTGTGWMIVLKEEFIGDPDLLYQSVKTGYDEAYDIAWLDLYGFNNTFALAVPDTLATELGLVTYTDLLDHDQDLKFGSNSDFFGREDGYPGLQTTYGLDFGETVEFGDIGLKYLAIANGEVDVINVFSTDGRLEEFNLTVLEDDLNFFPSYYATTLVRNEILEEYPELEGVLNMLAGQITNDDMIRMNYLVEIEKADPKQVALDFLEEKGLI